MNTAESIAAAVAAASQAVLPVGGGTKPGLAASSSAVQRLDMRGCSGIVGYEPSEYLITVRGGTPVRDVQHALAEHGQYLPFDPLFVGQGATMGGSVASGLSGCGQLLYGRLRDFVMEVELIDGLGNRVRGGGKVVKNAAGFDLPKLVVGSYGRLGILTEVTLKVFPRPAASASLTARLASLSQAVAVIQRLRAAPLPLAALELELSPDGQVDLAARFSGPAASLPTVIERAATAFSAAVERVTEPAQEETLWQQWIARLEQLSAPPGLKLRIAGSLAGICRAAPQLLSMEAAQLRISAAGAVAWLSIASPSQLPDIDRQLRDCGLSAIVLDAPADALLTIGDCRWLEMARRIQRAIDPQNRFVPFGDGPGISSPLAAANAEP